MKKLIYIFTFFACFAIACSSDNSLPAGILTEEQMVSVIVDLETHQAMYKMKFSNKDTVSYNQLAAYVFKQQNTSKEAFNTSLAYYAKYPKQLESFYASAIEIISEKQAAVQNNNLMKD